MHAGIGGCFAYLLVERRGACLAVFKKKSQLALGSEGEGEGEGEGGVSCSCSLIVA